MLWTFMDLYSISKRLLEETLDWMSTITNIDQQTQDILFQARNTFLFYQGEIYVKKNNPEFDVPQGGFDSAEVSEMVGLYILHCLRDLPVTAAIYRDDGCVLSRLTPFETERVKKRICEIFTGLGLRVKISANQKIIDFLDVTLNLTDGTYKPFRKPGDTPRLCPHPIKSSPGRKEKYSPKC